MKLIKLIVLTIMGVVLTNNTLAVSAPVKHKTPVHAKVKKHHRKHKAKSIKKYVIAANQTAPDVINVEQVISRVSASEIKPSSSPVLSARPPRLYTFSAKVVDDSNANVLVSKNSTAVLPIASITKLMTAMVLLDAKVDLDQIITIAPADVDGLKFTTSRLKVGMQLRRSDLLLLALMSSENRAAASLARTTYSGGIDIFVRKMNQKAISLGMVNTKFYDATGLNNSNVSTADDLAKMVKSAYDYPLIKQDTTTKEALVQLSPKYAHRYLNSDRLVRNGQIQIALSKTGFINEAGHCLVLYTIISGHPIIMIFLNSPGNSGRLLDALAIRNYLEDNLKTIAVKTNQNKIDESTS